MAGSMLKVEGQGHSCLQQEKGQDSVDWVYPQGASIKDEKSRLDESEDEDEKCPQLKGLLDNANGMAQNQKDHSDRPGWDKGLSLRYGEEIKT